MSLKTLISFRILNKTITVFRVGKYVCGLIALTVGLKEFHFFFSSQ